MQQQVLKISKSQVGNLIERLDNPAELDACLNEVKRMLAIKQRLALESEVGC